MRDTADCPDPASLDAQGTLPLTAGAWVVGIDGSAGARHAANWAATHAAGRASSLRLTSAWVAPVATIYPPFEPVFTAETVATMERGAREAIDGVAAELRPTSTVPIETVVTQGGSSQVLLEAGIQGSMLVVGSRGRGGFARLLLGSTSTQCATHATVPTTVVPVEAPVEETTKILVAVDGSTNSLAALHWAIDFAAPGTVIDCVRVWDVTPIAVGADQFFFPEASDLARERFDHQLRTVSRTHSRDRVEIQGRFLEGRPRDALAECADEAHLFVMGARGHGAVSSALLGSVSSWLLHHVRRPMVVVPHADHRADHHVDHVDTDAESGQDGT